MRDSLESFLDYDYKNTDECDSEDLSSQKVTSWEYEYKAFDSQSVTENDNRIEQEFQKEFPDMKDKLDELTTQRTSKEAENFLSEQAEGEKKAIVPAKKLPQAEPDARKNRLKSVLERLKTLNKKTDTLQQSWVDKTSVSDSNKGKHKE